MSEVSVEPVEPVEAVPVDTMLDNITKKVETIHDEMESLLGNNVLTLTDSINATLEALPG